MDECGIEQGLYRPYARSLRGVPVIADIHDQRFAARVNVIAAYMSNRLQAPCRVEGSIDTTVFNQWVEHCLVPVLSPGQVVIMDNARFHQSARTCDLVEAVGCQVLFLPTYSPDLNKIEHQWAHLKHGIRSFTDPDLSFLEKLDHQLIIMSDR